MSRKSPTSTHLGREKRHQTSVEIRKQGRDARVAAERTAGNNPAELPLNQEELNQLKRFGIPQLVDDFRSGSNSILRATMATRKLLSVEKETNLVDKMITVGLIDDLCKALDRSDSPRLQFEAIWGLTNASLCRPEAVVRCGALPKIVYLLDSKSVPLREQCLWSLGNIMSKTVAYRNQCVALGALIRIRNLLQSAYLMSNEEYEAMANQPILDSLIQVMNGIASIPISRQNFIRQATWAMSSALRGGDVPEECYREISFCLPQLRDLLTTNDDPNIVANTLWIIADYSEKRPRNVLELGVCDRILELGLHAHGTVQSAAAQCISNMCIGDGQSLRALMLFRRGDLILCSQLRSERSLLWLTSSWTLSYVCSQLKSVCERLIPESQIFLDRMQDYRTSSEIRQDCACIISSIFGNEIGCQFLQSSEAILIVLVNSLDSNLEKDIDLAAKIIQCTLNLLQWGGKEFQNAFEERGGYDRLQRLDSSFSHLNLPKTNPLHLALSSLEDLDEEESYAGTVSASPNKTPMLRQGTKSAELERSDFQSFMKD